MKGKKIEKLISKRLNYIVERTIMFLVVKESG